MVPEMPIYVGGLTRLIHDLNAFLELGGLESARVLTILRVAGGKSRRRMAVRYSNLARRTLNKIINSDHFDLRCAVVLHRFRVAAGPLCRLACHVFLFLFEHFLKLFNF